MKCCIIGCGWLGKPLAISLVSEGYEVFGSVRNADRLEELRENHINAFLYDGSAYTEIPEEHRTSDWLIICFPPSKSSNYSQQVESLVSQISPNTQILFTSTTGVYFQDEFVNESSEVKRDHIVYLSERIVIQSGREYVILRLAGLIGGERHPVKQLSGKTLEDGQHPVNLVHRSDVIHAVLRVVASGITNHIFNVVYPDHPSRGVYYTQMAMKMQLPLPEFHFGNSSGKRVDGSTIEGVLKFTYSQPIDQFDSKF
jgi:nucleoside-diphosphate-sugar epimerase